MNQLPLPGTETERLSVLREYNILDTLPEGELDDLTRLASIICNTPIALISLIDEKRQWFKSNIGLNAAETPRNISFCQYAIMGDEVYEVPNASENPTFAQNPLVTGYPNIRFYAGAPLVNPAGFPLGTLCVIDTVPRQLDEKQKETLMLLSRLVIQQFELRRKKAEVESSRMLFHKMVEEVADIIYTADYQGNFTFINQKVESILGYTPAELIGKSFQELIIPDWKKQVAVFYAEQFAQQKPETKLEFPVFSKQGQTRWVEQSVTVIVKDSRVQGFQGIVRDITDRKKYETELLETKALLTQAMSIGRLGSFENNVVTQKIIWSKEIYEMMDMEVNEKPMSYDQYIQAIHPEDMPDVLRRIQATIESKKSDVNVNRFITGTGRIKWIETRVVPFFDLDGNLIMFRGTMQDISEQKELEKLLISSKEIAEQSVVAKDQFLANMSHEIRTPMNAVLGFADLLDTTPLDQDQKEYVHAIQTSGKNLMAIINDILDYSKIEAGMMTIEETPLSIRSIFSSLAVLFGQKAKEKSLGLMFTSDPAIPETVVGDSTRLTQVITNLVGNALKFTFKGSIQVRAKLGEVTDKKVEVRFTVKDTGIGIAPAKLSAIFERFNQGSNSTTRQFGGTGLGLSIVKKLVELQGGEVLVSSEQDNGSVFEFTIQFKPHAQIKSVENTGKARSISSSAHRVINVLLVEDNIMNQKLAERILHNMGYTVEIAGNGQIAVDKVQEKKYDLVLMDMQMPEMDGYEAATVIRKKLNSNIPIIAMTAHAMIGEKEKCLDLGMNDYIAKPFKPELLQEKILALTNENTGEKTPLLNFDGLNEISGGDQGFIQSMLQLFVEDTPLELESMHEAIEQENYTVIKTVAHKLISSIGLVGLKDRLLHVLHELEDLGKAANDLPRIKMLYADLNTVCRAAFEEAKTHLQNGHTG